MTSVDFWQAQIYRLLFHTSFAMVLPNFIAFNFCNFRAKMSTSFHKGLLLTSLALLFHAAYSAAEWRSYARKSEQVQSDSIPLDITLETVVGLSLAMFAVLKIGGKGF